MRLRPIRATLLAGAILVAPGISTSAGGAAPAPSAARTISQTTAGLPIQRRRTPSKISEVRRITGLTWDQLAQLFGVSRRAVHFWASGKEMSSENEARLSRVAACLLSCDRGSARANREALFTPHHDATVPFDLLMEGHYDRFVAAMLDTEEERVAPRQRSTRVAVAPPSHGVDSFVGALQDRAHRETGTARRAKSVRVSGG
jgi:DNA-binding transcriptional regulator YiaG